MQRNAKGNGCLTEPNPFHLCVPCVPLRPLREIPSADTLAARYDAPSAATPRCPSPERCHLEIQARPCTEPLLHCRRLRCALGRDPPLLPHAIPADIPGPGRGFGSHARPRHSACLGLLCVLCASARPFLHVGRPQSRPHAADAEVGRVGLRHRSLGGRRRRRQDGPGQNRIEIGVQQQRRDDGGDRREGSGIEGVQHRRHLRRGRGVQAGPRQPRLP